MNVVLEFDSAGIERALDRIKSKMKSATDVLASLWSQYGYRDVIRHFKNEEGPGYAWAPLAESTQRHRVRHKRNATGPILQFNGDLRQSILPDEYEKVDDTSIRITATAPYSGYHQHGTARIPKREFMWISDNASKRMAGVFVKILKEEIDGGI